MTMFGYNRNMETVSPINPSAVGYQNKRPQVYGLAKLSAIDPAACEMQRLSIVDWWTAGFAALGILVGLASDSEAMGFIIPLAGVGIKWSFTDSGECQGVPNALFDVLAGGAACQATQFARTGRSIWTGKKK